MERTRKRPRYIPGLPELFATIALQALGIVYVYLAYMGW